MIYGCRYIIKIEKIAKMQRREVILMQTEINYQQLGQRVREKRKAMNVQQKDMAIAIGTATNHLSDIERGRKKPSLELLMRISSFLDTPVDYFLIKHEEPREYAVYQKLSIQSFIAVPVKPRPLGFLVVRNPRKNTTESSLLKMLAFVTLSIINEKKLMDRMRFAIQPENIRKDTDILVNLFGSLEIYTSRGVLKEADIKSQKILRMIAYLLLNRKSSVPPREMAEALWPEEGMDIGVLSNNMRGLLFRLRNTFGLICQHNLIESTPNGYRLNPKLNIMTDLQQFDKCCDAVPRAISTSEKIDLLKQAVRIYKGNVLTSAEAEHWLMLTASHYNLKYVGIVNELLRMLADAECYHDLHKYAAQSLSIEPGNIYAYYWLIYSMVHLGSFDLAKSEYEMAQRYLTNEEYKELTDMLQNLRSLAPEDLFYIRKLPDA